MALSYRDNKSYAVAIIAQSYDIKELEAHKYLEKVEEVILEHLHKGGDFEETSSRGSNRPSVVQDYVSSVNDQRKMATLKQDSMDAEAAANLPDIG